jgi:hypothetical protein
MADSDDILQRIALLGADDIRKELNALGDDGAAALKKIEAAGGGDLSKGIRSLMPEVAKFDAGLQSATTSAGKLPGIFGKIAAAVKGLGSKSGLGELANQTGEVDKASAAATKTIRGMGITLRALSRATGAHELGQLGSIIRSIGVNIELIAFPTILVGLGAIARSASNATQVVQDLAFKTGELPATFAQAANAAVAVGGSAEKLGESLSKLPALTAAAAKTQEEAAKAAHTYRDALDAAGDSVDNARDAVSHLGVQQQQLVSSLTNGKIALQDYYAAQAGINEQRQKANVALARAYEAEVKVTQEYQRQKRAALENADALTKLGIVAAQFKRLNSVQREDVIADALKNFGGPETERKALAFELLGENARKLYPSLLQGAAGMAKLRAESERIAPSFTAAQDAIGDKFTTAISQLGDSILSLKNQFGIAVSPAFIDFMNLLRDAFIAARPAITSLGQAVASVLKPVFEGIGIILTGIVIPAFKFLAGMFDTIAKGLNYVFGSNLTGAQVFTAVIIGLVAAFAPWVPILILAAKAVSNLWEQLKKIDWAGLFKPAMDFGTGIVSLVNDAAIGISNAFNIAIEYVKGLWNDLKSTISGWANSVSDYISSVIDKVRELGKWLASLAGAGGSDAANVAAGTAPAMAGGGEVHGPGTARSDSIWARLSNGEFVIQQAAVQKVGTRFLHAINSLALSPKSIPGFNMGGLVDALAPVRPARGFMDGGSVTTGGPNSIINLTIGTESFMGLRAPEDTAAKVVRYARRQGIRSGGRKPGWYGGG